MNAKMKSAKPAKQIQPRQKSSAKPAKLDDPESKRKARNLARKITRKFPIRTWAKWTRHQKHGWWTHVISGRWDQVRFTQADMGDLENCWKRCEFDTVFDAEFLAWLDRLETNRAEADAILKDGRDMMRRKARAQ